MPEIMADPRAIPLIDVDPIPPAPTRMTPRALQEINTLLGLGVYSVTGVSPPSALPLYFVPPGAKDPNGVPLQAEGWFVEASAGSHLELRLTVMQARFPRRDLFRLDKSRGIGARVYVGGLSTNGDMYFVRSDARLGQEVFIGGNAAERAVVPGEGFGDPIVKPFVFEGSSCNVRGQVLVGSPNPGQPIVVKALVVEAFVVTGAIQQVGLPQEWKKKYASEKEKKEKRGVSVAVCEDPNVFLEEEEILGEIKVYVCDGDSLRALGVIS